MTTETKPQHSPLPFMPTETVMRVSASIPWAYEPQHDAIYSADGDWIFDIGTGYIAMQVTTAVNSHASNVARIASLEARLAAGEAVTAERDDFAERLEIRQNIINRIFDRCETLKAERDGLETALRATIITDNESGLECSKLRTERDRLRDACKTAVRKIEVYRTGKSAENMRMEAKKIITAALDAAGGE